jgi:hypothetical protein
VDPLDLKAPLVPLVLQAQLDLELLDQLELPALLVPLDLLVPLVQLDQEELPEQMVLGLLFRGLEQDQQLEQVLVTELADLIQLSQVVL